ncbi:coiled-coil domain-containing protein, partial [Clarias magur]
MRRGKRKANDIDLSLQQSAQDMPQKSRVEKVEKGLFVVQSPQNQQKISSRTKSSEKGLQEAKQTIEDQKKEIATLKDWVDTLKEERDFLRERLKEGKTDLRILQLQRYCRKIIDKNYIGKEILNLLIFTALAVRSDKGGDVASNIPPMRQASGKRKQESSVTDSSSSDSSSDSESDSESSGTKKAKKKKSQPKKAKKMGKKLR